MAVLILTLLASNGLVIQGVQAAVSAQAVCDALGYEQLSGEVHYAVTKQLTLPTALSDAQIEWSSDSPAIDPTTGEVNRDRYKDTAVVLTARVTSGSDVKTKTFPFTVLSEQAEIYMAESVPYSVDTETRMTEVPGVVVNTSSNGASVTGKGWAFSKGTTLSLTPTGGMDAVVSQIDGTETAQNNYALKLWREGITDNVPHYLRYDLDQKASGTIVWEADIKTVHACFPQVYIFELYGAYAKNGRETRIRIAEFNLRFNSSGAGNFSVYYWNTEGSQLDTKSYSCTALESADWNRIKVVLDTNKQVWNAYVNGIQINTDGEIPLYQKNKTGPDNGELVYMNDFQISTYRGYTGGTLYVDNISVRKDTSEYSDNAEAYAAAEAVTEAAVLGDNASAAEITGDLSLPSVDGCSVRFISSDESAIDSQGRYVNTSSDDKVVTLTVAVIKGSQTAKKSFSLVALAAEQYRRTNAVYDMLSFECFTNEPPNAVTRDLDLSWQNLTGICDLEGVAVSFSSTNPEVLNSVTGEVTRQAADVHTQLNMTVAWEGYSKEKSMDVVVLGRDKEVYYSSNFRNPEHLGQDVSVLDKWSNGGTTTNRVTTLENVDNNYVLRSYRQEANQQDISFAGLRLNQACTTAFTTELRLKLMQEASGVVNAPSPIYVLEVDGLYNVNSQAVTAKVAELRFGYDTHSIRFNYKDGNFINYIDIETLPNLDTWFDLKLDFDVLEHGFDVYIDGEKINSEKLPFYQKYAAGYSVESFERFGGLYFTPMRTVEKLSMLVDDVAVTGCAGLHHSCRLYENGEELKSIHYLNHFAGNSEIDVKVICANDASETKTFDVLMAVYDNGRLVSVRKSENPLTLADGANGEVTFTNVALKDDTDALTIKCFAWEPEGIRPINVHAEVSGRRKFAYTPQSVDGGAGRDITYIDLNGEKAYKVYFNAQSWSSDSKKMYFHTVDPEIYTEYITDNSRKSGHIYSIYEYDRQTDEIRFINKCNYFYGFVTAGDYLIFANENNQVVRMNTETYAKELIAPLPAYVTDRASQLTVTNDGRYLAVIFAGDTQSMGTDGKYYCRFPVLDMATGVWNDSCFYGFDDVPPYNTCINPVYPTLLLFNHANDANNERIWVMNTESGTAENLYVQKPYTATVSGESVSHECWTYDGERLVLAVNHIGERQLGPNGVVSINKEGKDRRVVNNEYGYLHFGASPVSDRWVVGDTGYGNGITSQIVLVDLYSGASHLLATVKQTGKDSVAHCHPAFTPDGKAVYFGMYNADYSSNGIGIIDVSDIIDAAPTREEITLSANCQTERIADALPYTDGGYKIADGKQMNVNYTGEEKENTPATVAIEYYAESSAAATLEYYCWTQYTDTDPSKLETKTKEIPTEAGKWATVQIPLSDINLEGYGMFGGDFAIKATGGNVIVRSVRVDTGH